MSSTRVKHQYGVVDWLNDTEMQMTGMKSKNMIELKEVPLAESYPPENILSKDVSYPYLLQPREEHDDERKRAMNKIWSKGTYMLSTQSHRVPVIG